MKLTIELVPSTCWFSNVRSSVTKKEWDCIRRDAYRRAGYDCEICGGHGPKHPVECHEKWEYDDKKKIQRLVRMLAICPACHEVKHIGFAGIRGRTRQATRHLRKVNKWTAEKAARYVAKSFEIWDRRSEYEWKLDITYLKRYGITKTKLRQECDQRV